MDELLWVAFYVATGGVVACWARIILRIPPTNAWVNRLLDRMFTGVA